MLPKYYFFLQQDCKNHQTHQGKHYDKSNYEIINLGNNRTINLNMLIAAIEKEAGKKALLEKLPDQPGDVPHTFADISKAKELLNYSPATTLEEGLIAFRKWFDQNHST